MFRLFYVLNVVIPSIFELFKAGNSVQALFSVFNVFKEKKMTQNEVILRIKRNPQLKKRYLDKSIQETVRKMQKKNTSSDE